MEKINVALCITELDVGGAEKVFTMLVCGLDRTQFTPHVYILRSNKHHLDRHFLEIIEAANIPIHYLNIKGVGSLLTGIFKLRSLLKKQKTDVIQSFLFHANIVGRIAACLAGVPVVLSGIRVSEHSSRWQLTADYWTSRLVQRYICVSDSVARYTTTFGGIPSNKISTITNGIRMRPWSYSEEKNLLSFGEQTKSQTVLFVGRLTEQKGLDWFLDTMPLWLTNRENTTVLLAGSGPDDEKLKRQASVFPFSNRIRFLGYRSDISNLMRESTLLVLPSRWEGMPNVVLEAMNEGLPVLTTSVDGIFELLGNNANEQCCTFGDTNMFVEKINYLLDHPEERYRLARANHLQLENEFSIEKKIKEYENVWKNMYTTKLKK